MKKILITGLWKTKETRNKEIKTRTLNKEIN
jgi:hypothetical protein